MATDRSTLKYVAQIATAVAALTAAAGAGFRVDVSCDPGNRIYPDALHEEFPREFGVDDEYPPPLIGQAPWAEEDLK